ncbi:MAG: hypothetical protein E7177_08185 [Erysipelotrichaceae bacterium]|nr:hypothetical protein [Erysipelotrichaceae bacterium]
MKKERLLKIYKNTKSILNRFIFFLLPIITCIIFLLICKANDLYPFGNYSIAWCDMKQQVIPLLNSFKDILEGKQGFSYNLSHAGGMSFFSVYFFFLSSPFSYLVVFIEKSLLPNFVNLLVMFKLMVISFTFSYYISKKYKNVNCLINIALTLLYTFSIYTLMYYQNIMWLDIVYMFPLLILSLDYLLEKNKFIPYLICITSIVLLNYYISFMVICFVIFYMGLQFIFKKNDPTIKDKSKTFVFSSIIGGMLSLFSIIPSFIEYLNSARSDSLIENLNSSYFITHLFTVLPLLFGTLTVIPFIFKKDVPTDNKIKYILLSLLLIPMILDPINKMWHLGSYQAFPCRFAFIVTFLILDIVSANLNDTLEEKFSIKSIFGIILSIILIICLFNFENNFIDKRIGYLDQYAHGLWGDKTSFEALCRYYIIILICVFVVYALFKLKLTNKKILGLTLVNLSIIEVLFSTSVYLVSPKNDSSSYQELYSLQEYINDDSFYRVKTDSKLTDVNVINGAGFSSLGHYTSLTNEDYMFTMKKLGYSSYWMEVGQNGGTAFTDALLQNKYTLYYGNSPSAYINTEHYHFKKNDILPFGILTTTDLSKETELKEDSRVNMQEHIYTSLFNDGTSLHTTYSPSGYSNVEEIKENNRTIYYTTGNGTLYYTIKVTEKEKLYFEAFDKYSNSLSEAINDKISIYSPRKYVSSYPTQSVNGTIYLGEYENTTVNIKITIKQTISVSSLNVFSIKDKLLDEKIKNATPSNLKVSSNKIEGSYVVNEDSYLFLPISYSDNIKVRINNKKVETLKVFSSFVAIKLTQGENNIKITYSQKGLPLGIILSLLGLTLLVLFFIFKNKIKEPKIISKITYIASITLSALVFFIIYIFPLLINVIHQIK